MSNRIRKATNIELPAINASETSVIVPETNIVTKKMVTTQRMVLFLSRFDAAGSDLDTTKYPFNLFNKNGGRQDKSYGLGRVDFLRAEPAVAVQAVSF